MFCFSFVYVSVLSARFVCECLRQNRNANGDDLNGCYASFLVNFSRCCLRVVDMLLLQMERACLPRHEMDDVFIVIETEREKERKHFVCRCK